MYPNGNGVARDKYLSVFVELTNGHRELGNGATALDCQPLTVDGPPLRIQKTVPLGHLRALLRHSQSSLLVLAA